ncbi:MAG: hypothetical protein ACK5P5_10105 [Pseudobdellovibrionaceae bacterium]
MTYIQVVVLILVIVSSACTRKDEDGGQKSAVQFAFPHSISPMSNKLSAMSASELVHVSISVRGPGMTGPMLYEWDSCDHCISAPPPPTTFEMFVPSGEARFFQVMTVYDGDAGLIFRYGDTKKTLATAQETVGITMDDLNTGEVGTGRVSGRYLTAPDAGPTDRVEVRYRPPGKPPMVLFEEEIVNGWFSFFMLSGGLNFEYYVKSTGQTLWGGPVNLDSPSVSPTSTNELDRMKMFIPVHKRLRNSIFEDDESKQLIWGYYSDNGSFVSAKKVCLEQTSITSIHRYIAPPTLLIAEYRHGPTASFSGLPSYATLNTEGTSSYDKYLVLGGQQYDITLSKCDGLVDSGNIFTNFLKIETKNFDGNGNDAVAGFKGVFVNSLNLSDNNDSIRIEGWVIPDVLPSSGKIKAFKRTVLAGAKKIDRPDCTQLESQGFVGTGSEVNPYSFWNFSIDTDISTGDAEAGQIEVVLCPIFSGNSLSPIGAIHLDSERMKHLDP